MASLSFKPVTLDASHGDDDAMLVFRDNRLSAIVTRLGDSHGDAAGRWFVETAFSDTGALHKTFDSLVDLEAKLSALPGVASSEP